jgi:hypothetical protein
MKRIFDYIYQHGATHSRLFEPRVELTGHGSLTDER